MLEYKIIYSKRKTTAIHITRDALIEVRAPFKTPKSFIDSFVRQNENRLQAALNKMIIQKEKRESAPPDIMFYLGREYRVKDGGKVEYKNNEFYVPGKDVSKSEDEITVLYKKLAKGIINDLVAMYSEKLGVSHKSVSINKAKTRWGSCSGTNRLNFSCRLVMADLSLIEYVVIHELCHISEHNHSKRFWKLVEKAMPDYKERRKELRDFQKKLYEAGL